MPSFSELQSEIRGTQSERDIQSLQEIVKIREAPLNSAEVREFYGGAPSGERYSFSATLAQRAMLDAENARRESAGEQRLGLDNPIRLTRFNEIPAEGSLDISSEGTQGIPQVYYKQIIREEGNWLSGVRQVETDELVVVIRLNNSTGAEEESTVICGIVKQRGGVIDFDSNSNVFWNMTEAQYTRSMGETRQTLLGGEQDGLNKKAFTGQLSSEQFHKEYKKQNRRTLYQDMDAWDKTRGNKREAWKYEDVKKETLDRVNNDYGELLQEAERRSEEITKKTQEALRMNEEEVKSNVTSNIFKTYMFLDEAGFFANSPELEEIYRRMLGEQLGINPDTLELYKAQYKKERSKKDRGETSEGDAKRIVDEARAEAEEIVTEAQATAKRLIEQIRLEAEKARKALEERAEKVRQDAEAKVAEVTRELEEAIKRAKIEADRAEANARRLAEMEAQIKKLEASIVESNQRAQVAEAKAKESIADTRQKQRDAEFVKFQ